MGVEWMGGEERWGEGGLWHMFLQSRAHQWVPGARDSGINGLCLSATVARCAAAAFHKNSEAPPHTSGTRQCA